MWMDGPGLRREVRGPEHQRGAVGGGPATRCPGDRPNRAKGSRRARPTAQRAHSGLLESRSSPRSPSAPHPGGSAASSARPLLEGPKGSMTVHTITVRERRQVALGDAGRAWVARGAQPGPAALRQGCASDPLVVGPPAPVWARGRWCGRAASAGDTPGRHLALPPTLHDLTAGGSGLRRGWRAAARHRGPGLGPCSLRRFGAYGTTCGSGARGAVPATTPCCRGRRPPCRERRGGRPPRDCPGVPLGRLEGGLQPDGGRGWFLVPAAPSRSRIDRDQDRDAGRPAVASRRTAGCTLRLPALRSPLSALRSPVPACRSRLPGPGFPHPAARQALRSCGPAVPTGVLLWLAWSIGRSRAPPGDRRRRTGVGSGRLAPDAAARTQPVRPRWGDPQPPGTTNDPPPGAAWGVPTAPRILCPEAVRGTNRPTVPGGGWSSIGGLAGVSRGTCGAKPWSRRWRPLGGPPGRERRVVAGGRLGGAPSWTCERHGKAQERRGRPFGQADRRPGREACGRLPPWLGQLRRRPLRLRPAGATGGPSSPLASRGPPVLPLSCLTLAAVPTGAVHPRRRGAYCLEGPSPVARVLPLVPALVGWAGDGPGGRSPPVGVLRGPVLGPWPGPEASGPCPGLWCGRVACGVVPALGSGPVACGLVLGLGPPCLGSPALAPPSWLPRLGAPAPCSPARVPCRASAHRRCSPASQRVSASASPVLRASVGHAVRRPASVDRRAACWVGLPMFHVEHRARLVHPPLARPGRPRCGGGGQRAPRCRRAAHAGV